MTEWDNINNSGKWSDWSGPWQSSLKLHAAGFLDNTSGLLVYPGIEDDIWSSSQQGSMTGAGLKFNFDISSIRNSDKSYGLPLRCIADCAGLVYPAPGVHSSTRATITWNWTAVAGAVGYKWGTANNPVTATEIGAANTKTETGLTCNTSFTRYVWAFNECGISTAAALNYYTLRCESCNIPDLTINHTTAGGVAPVDKTVTYGTVTNIPGEPSKCWITRNLGASRQASSVSDYSEASAGWYWQFNRKQGYKHDGSVVTPSWNITTIDENSDWQTLNDPCTLELGAGWRVPTNTEWTNLNNADNWTNWNGLWNSGLKVHAAGYLEYSTGSLGSRGAEGFYWGSKQNSSSTGQVIQINNSFINLFSNYKTFGYSVRCLNGN